MHRRSPVNVAIRRTAQCSHVTLANDTKGSVCEHQTFPRLPRGSNQVHLATAVYHLRGNHTVTLYEKREKIRYHLRVWPLG